MNPPPLKPEHGGLSKTFVLNAAAVSLLAPIVVFLVGAAVRSLDVPRIVSLLIGLASFALIMAGIVFGILALCGVRAHGSDRILWKSILGLILGCLCMVFFATGVVQGFKHAQQSRQFTGQMNETVNELNNNMRQSYDSKTGLTNGNIAIAGVNKLRSQLDEASKTLSGEDAKMTKAMSEFVTELQSAAETFQSSVDDFRKTPPMRLSDLQTREELDRRRTIVNKFIAANSALSGFIAGAEKTIQTKLQAAKVSPKNIEQALEGYRSKANPRTMYMLKLRECDDRLGHRMLDVLNLLDTDWGKWHYNPANELVLFENPESRLKYSDLAAELESASSEEVTLQGRLLNIR